MGKSVLARALCSHYCKAKGASYYISTTTADSLRFACEQQLFKEGVAVMLDEWRPSEGKFSGPDGIDMLKCLTNVDTAAAIKGRYSDICFYDNQPRLMTCNTKDVTEWASSLGMVTTADIDAVLRRTIFIEINKNIIPQAVKDKYIKKKETTCFAPMAMLSVEQGIDVMPEEDYVWVPDAKRARIG